MVSLGFGESIVLYRKEKNWAGEPISGVSLTVTTGQSTDLHRYKNKSSRIETGRSKSRSVQVLVQSQRETLASPGDLLVWGQGDFPEQLDSPSQPKREGWAYSVIQQVTDRRKAALPHWELEGI